MPSLKEIRGRIKSAKNIQQITKAMKMVAAARLRRSQERMLAARPYALKIAAVIEDIASRGEASGQPLLEVREGALKGTGPLHLVVVGADKGLCGSFNVNIIRRAAQIVRENQDKRKVLVTVVGRKPRDFFKAYGMDLAASHVGAFQNLQYAFADALAKDLMESYLSGAVDEVLLLFTNFVSTMSLKVEEQRLLPFSMVSEAFEKPAEAAEGKAAFGDYGYEPSRKEILDALLPRAVGVAVWRALLESQASELAARMTAMDSATRNSKEMINSLTLKANRIRQAVITKEIAELVGGAEALK